MGEGPGSLGMYVAKRNEYCSYCYYSGVAVPSNTKMGLMPTRVQARSIRCTCRAKAAYSPPYTHGSPAALYNAYNNL